MTEFLLPACESVPRGDRMPAQLSTEYRQLLDFAAVTQVAETPEEHRAIVEQMVLAARTHPAFLAPLCFTIDRLDDQGYPVAMWPEWFHVAWLNAALQNDVRSVMLLAARGHAKSEMFSAVLPAWLLGMNPRLRILHITSSDDLAAMYSRRLQEVVQSDQFRMVFPDFPRPGKVWNAHEWYLDIPGMRDPTWRAKGAGSSITGGRADCLTGDTLVDTEVGPRTIKELVESENPPQIIGWWHGTERQEPRRLVASRVITTTRPLLEIVTQAGRRLRCTRDHRVWVGGGRMFDYGRYCTAGSLRPGEMLYGNDGDIDRVQTITEIPPETVYDIQVDGTHNFFANGILVHNCIIADDIVTLRNSATKHGRNNILSWYRTTLHPILVPGTGRMLIIGTRYYKDDLYGTFIDGGMSPLLYPAEDERSRIMWWQRFDRDFLEEKKNPPEGSLASYASQYLCKPINPEGEVFKKVWFEQVEHTPDLIELWWCWDTALSANIGADFTAGVLAGLGRDGNIYIIEVVRGQWDPTTVKKKIAQAWAAHKKIWGPLLRGVLVEDTKEGRVIQAWMREARDTRAIPIVMVPHGGRDKMARAALVIPYCEGHRVKLLKGYWTNAFLEELLDFTATNRHQWDDQVDAFVYVIAKLLKLSFSGGGTYRSYTGNGLR